LNSSFNTEINAIGFAPSASYFSEKSQFEIGIGFYPFGSKNQRIGSGEFNDKYFPNGRTNKYNLFLILSCSYVNQLKKLYFPAT
jgi:hypothetical protein